MVAKNRSFVLLAALFLTVAACSSTPEEPVMADPDGYADGLAYFESAYAELEEAIQATPQWETRSEYDIRVRGLAEVAIGRAEALRPYVVQNLISESAIVLMVDEVKNRARLIQPDLKIAGGSFHLGADQQIRSHDQENAYHRTWQRIETLETFALAKQSTPWIDSVVLTSVRGDLETIVATKASDTAMWKQVNVSREGFGMDQQRAQDLLDRLDGKIPSEPMD